MHIIVSDDGYWCNEMGWTDYVEAATRFENKNHNLPVGKNVFWLDTTNETVIFIEKEKVEILQKLLDQPEIDFHAEKIAEDSTIATFTAKFTNGYEADIKFCSGQTNCFIDPVLFDKQGYQLAVLDVEGDLLGTYEFEVEDIIYKVHVKQI